MRQKLKTVAMVAILAFATFGSFGVAMGQTEAGNDAVTVDPMNATDSDTTFADINTAVETVNDGGTVTIYPVPASGDLAAAYETDVNLTTNNVSFVAGSDDIRIVGELNGTWSDDINNVSVGDNVSFIDGVKLGNGGLGGAIGIGDDYNPLNDKLYGVPHALWGLLVLVVGYVGYMKFLRGRF